MGVGSSSFKFIADGYISVVGQVFGCQQICYTYTTSDICICRCICRVISGNCYIDIIYQTRQVSNKTTGSCSGGSKRTYNTCKTADSTIGCCACQINTNTTTCRTVRKFCALEMANQCTKNGCILTDDFYIGEFYILNNGSSCRILKQRSLQTLNLIAVTIESSCELIDRLPIASIFRNSNIGYHQSILCLCILIFILNQIGIISNVIVGSIRCEMNKLLCFLTINQ